MSKYTKHLILALFVVASSLYVAQYYWPETASNKQKITIAQVGDFFLYAPLYVAKDAGYFEKQNLDVTIISTGGDEKSWAAVIGGSAQFSVGDPTFVAISNEKGQPGVVLASVVNGVPFWGITLKTTIAPFASPSELAGHTVATFPAPSTAYTLQRDMFTKAGLEPSIRQGGFGALIPMLRAEQADIALELEPNVSLATHELGATVLYSLAKQHGDFAITGLAATPDYIRGNAETVRRTVCALRRAVAHIRENPDDALSILAKRFPSNSPEVTRSALDRVIADGIVPNGVQIGDEAWKKAIELRVAAGDLKQAASMDVYVDNSFAKAADNACVSIER